MTTPPAPPTVDPDAGEAGTLVLEGPRFAIVPEWMIDSPIPDAGFRLYSLLLRYGNSSGTRMPSRATLAHRLRRSVDAVDRALRQLVEADVVRVEHRRCDGVFLANRYHVRTTGPSGGGGRTSAATAASLTEGGRNIAATGGRRTAAGVAADLRPNPEDFTQSTPPPPGSNRPGSAASTASEPNPVEMADLQLLKACGIADVDQLSAACVAARHAVGRPATRWSARCLMVVIRLTVNGKGWPAALALNTMPFHASASYAPMKTFSNNSRLRSCAAADRASKARQSSKPCLKYPCKQCSGTSCTLHSRCRPWRSE